MFRPYFARWMLPALFCAVGLTQASTLSFASRDTEIVPVSEHFDRLGVVWNSVSQLGLDNYVYAHFTFRKDQSGRHELVSFYEHSVTLAQLFGKTKYKLLNAEKMYASEVDGSVYLDAHDRFVKVGNWCGFKTRPCGELISDGYTFTTKMKIDREHWTIEFFY